MLSIIAPPPDAQQIYVALPSQPPQPRLDRLDHRLLEVVKEEGTVTIWFLLNLVGDEETDDRTTARPVGHH
jgi:hypothetical protein